MAICVPTSEPLHNVVLILQPAHRTVTARLAFGSIFAKNLYSILFHFGGTAPIKIIPSVHRN